jgi:hypothetical protein
MRSFLICAPHQRIFGWSKMIRVVQHVACTGQKRNAYRFVVGKPVRKKLPGRPSRRWEYNIKVYI